ncbi:MAG: hypothetical protein QXP31_08370 [Pyrobaculum sp.]|uniref:hypothetical protein n=1 Tax=Pyrobaculum sp. TaxID=2004705 RepID=UPI0031662917
MQPPTPLGTASHTPTAASSIQPRRLTAPRQYGKWVVLEEGWLCLAKGSYRVVVTRAEA